MTGNDIRSQFLSFFAGHDHAIIESSSLVPQDDPTLLFTNSGMVQFKRVFMGEEKRDYKRASTCQRCVRAGGKHNDLENVGYTARHHTFFEMLGNFSFGDYFKEGAIRMAWEFLTVNLGLDREKLWVSVFEDDDEAFALWEKVEDLPKGRIVRLGESENFWAMGDTGPCGPCSEIHIDQGPAVGCGRPDCALGCDCDRYLELWNLVFMQFYRDESGKMTPLPKPSIDTGMGLERVAAVLQGKDNNYDSDLFSGLIGRIAGLSGKEYGADAKIDTAMRVIADHSRAAAFLVADGMLPSNEGRGYVLRRIMRRAVRFGRFLGLKQPFLAEITAEVVRGMEEAYPHLAESANLLARVVSNEEERFLETLDNGLAILNSEIGRLQKSGGSTVPGNFIFKLYDTYGFPVDIVRDIALEKGFSIDQDGFAKAMEEQRALSKKSWKGGTLAAMPPGVKKLVEDGHKTVFVGYKTHRASSVIKGLVDQDGEAATRAQEGERVSIFCPATPFYAEAGGQIGDQGEITGPQGKATVLDTTIVADGAVLHEAEVTRGTLSLDEPVELHVKEGRRQCIAANHSATHILHAVMKSVLGDHVKQSGSLVTPEKLRFDFTHFSPLTPEEIATIEKIANEQIRENTLLDTAMLEREEAIKAGAVALFGEKYGETVRVVSIGSFSRELCGGTHVRATGEIGLVKITAETGIAAGVRRIEAVTGPEAFRMVQDRERQLARLASLLRVPPENIEAKIEKLLGANKDLEKEVSRLTARLALSDIDSLIAAAATVGDTRVVVSRVVLDSPKTLREMGDRIRDKLKSGIVILGGEYQGKAALLAMVSRDLTGRYRAGDIIREIAALVGGKGGGRPDMAQAGGPNPDKLNEALGAACDIIEAQGG
ncbi:MAG: alanine--tRNA ligase [Deltaproteobacteria bacterium]|jgi:alanyl-tRNA synthetase|nr:alanine--tRNA ligase [Deltaproteobacteria bacterium]